jgi:membrane-anchored protein YejM (alkaline phosphatase superfamily)
MNNNSSDFEFKDNEEPDFANIDFDSLINNLVRDMDSYRFLNSLIYNYPIYDNIYDNIYDYDYEEEDDPINRVLEQSLEEYNSLEKTDYNLIIASQRFETLNDDIKNDNKNCSICIIDFEKDDMISITSCNHIFHTDCIKEWGKYKTDCPICRVKL